MLICQRIACRRRPGTIRLTFAFTVTATLTAAIEAALRCCKKATQFCTPATRTILEARW